MRVTRSQFTQTVPRPARPGDQCWNCGTPVVYRTTKRSPRPEQTYAYRGYLWCSACRSIFHCDEFKYQIKAGQPTKTLVRDYETALAKDRTEDELEREAIDKARETWLRRVNRK